MSNTVDCSAMFQAVNPAEVEIIANDPVKGKCFSVMHGGILVWETDDFNDAERARLSYCRNGV